MSKPSWAVEDGTRYKHPAGALFIDVLDSAGNRTGYRQPGSVKDFIITPSGDEVDAYASIDASRRLASSVQLRGKLGVKFTMDEWSVENAMLALAGELWDYTQPATAVTGESVGDSVNGVLLGVSYQVAKSPVDSATPVVVKDGVTTYVVGDDYIFDYPSGLLYITPGSSITPGSTTVTIDYTPIAIISGGQRRVTLGTNFSRLVGIRFVGDPSAGPSEEVELWRCRIAPQGDIGFISEEYSQIPVQGTILSDPVHAALTPPQPYGYYKIR